MRNSELRMGACNIFWYTRCCDGERLLPLIYRLIFHKPLNDPREVGQAEARDYSVTQPAVDNYSEVVLSL